jgi:hypothetical protein
MGVALRDYRYVSFLELDWPKSDISNKRDPTRTTCDDMILDHMLRAGRDVVGNLCRRRRFSDPRRFGGELDRLSGRRDYQAGKFENAVRPVDLVLDTVGGECGNAHTASTGLR